MERVRTLDVTSTTRSFAELMLSDEVVEALQKAGFVKPSPVQQAALPYACLGTDLVVQAKSGTGKTVVFATCCLARVRADDPRPQALVLAPTREIALQSAEVIQRLAENLPGTPLSTGVFIGGLAVEDDRKLLRRACQIVVGTPGRICALLEHGALQPAHFHMLVLDEADSLMTDSFADDVQWINEVLPKTKQVMAFSATYTPEALDLVESMMRTPEMVLLNEDDVSLIGIRQFYLAVEERGKEHNNGQAQVSAFEHKLRALLKLCSSVSFYQAVVFCNQQADAEAATARLNAAGFPAAYLSSSLSQVDRMDTLEAVRSFRKRIVVSTDLVARGIDLERVNLVCNLDLPRDAATYVHRVGRTGRYGTRGIAVTFATQPELQRLLRYLADVAGGQVETLPEEIPADLYAYQLSSEEDRAAFAALQSPAGSSPAQQPAAKRSAQDSTDPSTAWQGQQDSETMHESSQQPAAEDAAPSATEQPSLVPPPPPPVQEGSDPVPDDADDSCWLDNPWGPGGDSVDSSHPFRRPLNEGLELMSDNDATSHAATAEHAAESRSATEPVHGREQLPGQHAGWQSVGADAASGKPVRAQKRPDASRHLREKDVPLHRIDEDELEAAIIAAHAQADSSSDEEDAYVWYGEAQGDGQHEHYTAPDAYDPEADESAQMWMESVQASHAEADSAAQQHFAPSSWSAPAAAQQLQQDVPQTGPHDALQNVAHDGMAWTTEQLQAWWHWYQSMQPRTHSSKPAGPQVEHHAQSMPAADQGRSQSSQPAPADAAYESEESRPGSNFVLVPASLLRRYQELEWADWRKRYSEWRTAYESYSQWYQQYVQWQESQSAPMQY